MLTASYRDAPTHSVWSRGAVDVSICECFQPARGGVGRWPGHWHECAPPLWREGLGGALMLTASYRDAPTHSVWSRGAVDVSICECFQPARGGVGRWPGHWHECAPLPTFGGWAPRKPPACRVAVKATCHVCWRGAVYVLLGDCSCFQPACGCVGRWPGH